MALTNVSANFALPDEWSKGDWSALAPKAGQAGSATTSTSTTQQPLLSAPTPEQPPRNTATDTKSGLLKPNTGYTPTNATVTEYGSTGYTTTKMNPADVAKAKAATAAAAMAQAHEYEAYKQAVAKEDLTSYHLQKLLDGNSDYIKRAKTEGLQQANARGLLNTTMAAGAAHGAAIDRAMPIASQDAGTYNERALTHIAEENTARRTNATNKTNVSISNANNQTNVNVANANNQTQVSRANAERENQFWQDYLNAENRQSEFAANAANNAARENAIQQTTVSVANAGYANTAAADKVAADLKVWEAERARDHEIVTAKMKEAVDAGVVDRNVAHNLQGKYLTDAGIITDRYSTKITDIMTNASMWGAVDEKTGVSPGQAAINKINGYWVDENGKQYDTEQPGARKVTGMREADLVFLNSVYEAQPMWNYNFNQAEFPSVGV
jgi:hypothetical protein